MGKIRVTTIGDDFQEDEEKKKKQVKKAEKKARDIAEKKTEGEEISTEVTNETPEKKEVKIKKNISKSQETTRSATYTSNAMQVDKSKLYTIDEGLKILKNMKKAKFDETVELHINTTESGISGQMTLPHGNGKEIRVAIADEKLLAEVEKGKINFDVLIATPSQMPQLAKVAKVLGPRGLMPNPKNGTISEKPEEAVKKFKGGQMNYKTESKLPLIHLAIGKISFEEKQLKENIVTIISAIKKERIKKMTLKSTMSPGIRIQL